MFFRSGSLICCLPLSMKFQVCILDVVEEADASNEPNESESIDQEPLSLVELLAKQQNEVNTKKLEIAQWSQNIVENPDANVSFILTEYFLIFTSMELLYQQNIQTGNLELVSCWYLLNA